MKKRIAKKMIKKQEVCNYTKAQLKEASRKGVK